MPISSSDELPLNRARDSINGNQLCNLNNEIYSTQKESLFLFDRTHGLLWSLEDIRLDNVQANYSLQFESNELTRIFDNFCNCPNVFLTDSSSGKSQLQDSVPD